MRGKETYMILYTIKKDYFIALKRKKKSLAENHVCSQQPLTAPSANTVSLIELLQLQTKQNKKKRLQGRETATPASHGVGTFSAESGKGKDNF